MKIAAVQARVRGLPGRIIGSDVGKGTAFVLMSQVLSKGILYAVTLFMAHSLSLVEFGTFNYFVISSALLATYFSVGLPLAATKLVAQLQPDARRDRHELTSALVAINFAGTLVACAAAPLYVPLVGSDEFPLHWGWLVAAAVTGSWAGLAQASLFGLGKFKAALMPVLIGSSIFLIGAVVAHATGELEPLLLGSVAGSAVSGLWSLACLRRFDLAPSFREWSRPKVVVLRDALAVALPSLGLSVVSVTWSWLVARALVERQTTVAEFGIFSVGLQWYALLMLVPTAASVAFLRSYSRKSSERDYSNRAVLIPALLVGGSLLALAPLAALATPALTWLYGGSLTFSPTLVAMVVAAAAVTGAQALLAHAVIAFQGAHTWLKANIAAIVVAIMCLQVMPPTTAFRAFFIILVVNVTLVLGALSLLLRAGRIDRQGEAELPPGRA